MAEVILGIPAMISKIQKIIDWLPDLIGAALKKEAMIEAQEARRRCPVLNGILRASIHVEGPFRKGRLLWCDVVAGGKAGAYALVQHENLEFHHPVGQAKYIESVLMESRPFMAARIARRVQLQQLVA